MSTQTSTFFALMAEYGTGDIPLFSCCQKYFGMDEKKAGHCARHQKLPVPAYRGGSQKSMWLINTADLARFIDAQREKAKEDWRKMNGREADTVSANTELTTSAKAAQIKPSLRSLTT